jgi:hypothetical protein
MTKPRSCAYSTNAAVKRASVSSASSTTAFIESGITTGNTPPKKAQPASKPATTASVVWRNESHTKQYRE